MNKYRLLKEAEQLLNEHNLDIKLAKYIYEGLFDKKDNINNDEFNLYQEKIADVINGKSVQYVIGKINFYGYNFIINENVLIPRFETEELIYNTINYIKRYFNSKASVVDIGTGSGAIAITLKKEISNLDVYATDISKEAIEVATNNAKALDTNIKFLIGDMLKPLTDMKFDVLISNPPYLKKDDPIDQVVLDNEPHLALFGGNDGLKYYKDIFKDANNVLNYKSLICLEVSEEIKEGLIPLIKQYFNNSKYEFKKDMSGRTRMLFIFNNLD